MILFDIKKLSELKVGDILLDRDDFFLVLEDSSKNKFGAVKLFSLADHSKTFYKTTCVPVLKSSS